MTKQTSFASFKRTYRPWGQVRRKNFMSRAVYVLSMSLLGLALIAGLALLVVFAASVAMVGVATVALIGLAAFVVRTPAKIFVRAQRDKMQSGGKGVYEARKKGSTWSVY